MLDKLGIPLWPRAKSTISTFNFIHQHIQLYHMEKRAVANHSINLSDHIQFYDTSILAKKFGCMGCLIRKVISIWFPSWQHEEGRRFLPKKVMEAFSNPERKNQALSKENWLTPACFDFPLMALLMAILASSYPPALLLVAQSGTTPNSFSHTRWSLKGSPSSPVPTGEYWILHLACFNV